MKEEIRAADRVRAWISTGVGKVRDEAGDDIRKGTLLGPQIRRSYPVNGAGWEFAVRVGVVM